MTENYVYVIVALLPLTASMLVFQVNPYHALVIRGILGAVSALVYAMLGAADVALTEALVGTLLSVTLYAVAVRSSLVMRLGVLQDKSAEAKADLRFKELTDDLRVILSKRHLRLELVPYPDPQALHQALITKEVHASCMQRPEHDQHSPAAGAATKQPYQIILRVKRLYNILQSELLSPATSLTYAAAEASTTDLGTQDLGRVPS
ncbi:DUF4040 domain-containing protein [Pseudanabaena sp. FACHB-2040]|uniref:DUF4040 domain-containing protein n=1 Tax=Pseudanabaena sp. FACHB-2040 TaxID=2692859 RepID=UPI00168703BD|nr:DUF4040 domain-containing protein [Pseudanabaena sp. FACHB-2040]MBD2259428.1 DUF4040 domain-containing protein [Pseudanabaena sp. FACHB-2040]